MIVIGKIHEISFYGLLTTMYCLVSGKITFSSLVDVSSFFEGYLFWTTVLFVPIAAIGALVTKYIDGGRGLLFKSDSLLVIAFSHIAEELLGLILTPIWLIKDLVKGRFDDEWKIVDYVTYFIEIIFIIISVSII